MAALLPLAALPVAWWLSWALGGAVAFSSVVWVLTWFALRSDDHQGDPSAGDGGPRSAA